MEIQDSSAAIYSEAKSEYTKQLVFNFQPALLRFFLDRFKEVKESPLVTSRAKSALSEFQDSLSQIPEWNVDKVQREASGLLHSIQCDYVEDLITAVFIAHTKILSAIRLHSKPRRKINITVPKPDHFMHRAMSECSRLLWSNVYLFNDSVPGLDRQKNMNEVNKFLEEGILQAIRNLLPVKSILRDSLQEDDDDAIQVNTKTVNESEKLESTQENLVTEESLMTSEIHGPSMPSAIQEALIPSEPSASSEPLAPSVPSEPLAPSEPSESSAPSVPSESSESSVPLAIKEKSETFIIDTERSVGFTGIDSVFGLNGHAELIPSTQELDDSDELKILGSFEELKLDEFEDLDTPAQISVPLGADDYESL
jgi:hypothetical protein